MRLLVDALGIDSFVSGLSGYSLNVLSGLNEMPNIDLLIICNKKGKKKIIEVLGSSCNLFVIDAKVMGVKRELYYFKYRRLLSDKCDIFHCLSSYLPFFPPSVPSFVTLHDMKYVVRNEFMGRLRALIVRLYIKNTLKNASNVIAVSISTKHDAVNYGLDPSKCTVVYEGPCMTPNDVYEVSEQFEFPLKFILFVGENRPHKNIGRLVEAFQIANQKLPGYSLVIAGKNTEEFNDIVANDHVKALGAVSEAQLHQLYSNAELLVFPSLYEGFGLPILEAMTFGVPVITSMLTSTREIGGDAAVYVDPYNVKDISNKIVLMLGNKKMYDNYSKISVKHAALFNWQDVVSQYNDLYIASYY